MKIAFLFPGYGSQFVGMGKELYDEYRVVQEYFEEASNCLNINFVKLCFASSDLELAAMENAYPSLFLVSCALYAVLKQEGIEPTVVAGYNHGEYAALCAADGISFPDGLYLLTKFGSFYKQALETMSVRVIHVNGVLKPELEQLCDQKSTADHIAAIAIYRASQDCVVAGHTTAVDKVHDVLVKQQGVTVEDMGVELGLHSRLMDSVADQFEIYLEKVDFKDLKVPLLNCATGTLLDQAPAIKDHIIHHLTTTLNWKKVMDALEEFDLIVEIGPGTTLSSMVKERYPEKGCVALNTRADIEMIKKIITDHA